MNAKWERKTVKGSSMICYVCSRCNYVQGNKDKPVVCPSCKSNTTNGGLYYHEEEEKK